MRLNDLDLEPVRPNVSMHEAIRIVCEFSGRRRDEVCRAGYYSSRQIDAAPCRFKVEPFWRVDIAFAEGVVDEPGYGPLPVSTPQLGGGSFVVFEDGRVGTFADEFESPESELRTGHTGTMTDHPGVADIDGQSECVESDRPLAAGTEVVVVGVRDGSILLVEPRS